MNKAISWQRCLVVRQGDILIVWMKLHNTAIGSHLIAHQYKASWPGNTRINRKFASSTDPPRILLLQLCESLCRKHFYQLTHVLDVPAPRGHPQPAASFRVSPTPEIAGIGNTPFLFLPLWRTIWKVYKGEIPGHLNSKLHFLYHR